MRRRLLLTAACLLVASLVTPAATAQPPDCETRRNDTVEKLLECVTVDGVFEHLQALQSIADDNNGTRVSGTEGYDASVDYVVRRMVSAGYKVRIQPFEFNAFRQDGPSTLTQNAPDSVTYVEDVDYTLLDQDEPGDVTADVTAVDLMLGAGNTSTSGCETEDFDGFPAGNIALVQRGACTFELKAENAAAAGAAGVLIMNQGNTPEREGLASVTLGNTYDGGIPVLFLTYPLGVELSETVGLNMTMVLDVFRGLATTHNVIAETRAGDPNNVVMVGAHLDSVDDGPGINDNGSGSAAQLEVAENMANQPPTNRLRFSWWGAEESGLVGSTHYVNRLSERALGQIALYLNFDMVGSPNYGLFIYDGDGSDFGLVGPPGSDDIEATFESFFDDRGIPRAGTEFSGRSDYQAFINNGIPAGGLFTGADGIKTDADVVLWGGIAGEQYDQCYHQACDTIANPNMTALEINADAIAFTTFHYAMNFDEFPVLAATQSTTGSTSLPAWTSGHEAS